MSIINSQPRIGAAGQSTGFKIERSLRFNSADSAYLNRTPASAGNRKTWTWSGWVKFSAITGQAIISNTDGSNENGFSLEFTSGGIWSVYDYTSSTVWIKRPSNLLRDLSAWYHLVLAFDTTQATAGNRVKMYINGEGVTSFSSSTDPTLNYDGLFNTTAFTAIGRYGSNNGGYFSGYLTDINFIDGQALTPSSFGQTNSATGVWEPIAYTGTYGTNGFYLKFADNSGTTSTTLGKDSSGNSNNWTPNNFSVTAGAGNDSLVDTPTPYGTDTGAGGEVRGNYCTLNPLSNTAGTYTQGNLRFTGPNGWRRSNGTLAVSTGKWYWEVTISGAPYTPRANNSNYQAFGFGLSTSFGSQTDPLTQTDAVVYCDNGYYKNFSGANTDGGTAIALNDVLSIAVDLDANTFTFRLNNTQIATGTIGGTAGRELVPIIVSYANQYGVMDCNFGQRPFAYTAPSGFKALCTQNLPTPTIGATATTRADDYFNTVLYTGNGGTQSITGIGFAPQFVWLKDRSVGYGHRLYDSNRGVNNSLFSNGATAETTETGSLTSFDSDGFSLGSNAGSNANNTPFVSWNWNAASSSSSNTSGTITSTVRANTTAGFSIVTFTSPSGTGNFSAGHGLGVTPEFVIVKSRDAAGNWYVYHKSLATNNYLELNSTNAAQSATDQWGAGMTSSVIGLRASYSTVPSATTVAYCFAPVAGYSAFGSFTGNGSADGPFIYLGFRPKYWFWKRTDSTSDWDIQGYDTSYNPALPLIFLNKSDAEYTGSPSYPIDLLSNGVKIRSVNQNANGGTYIYAAFAENPFKYSLAR